MDFPVPAGVVMHPDAGQVHDSARGDSPAWPASFVQLGPDEWVYRVDDSEEYQADVEGAPVPMTRDRPDVVVDEATVRAALDRLS